MTDVNIKNIPLAFLKEKPRGFFESDTFKKAVAVFDKYKSPVTSDSDVPSLESAIQPNDMLFNMLLSKYNGAEVIPTTQIDKEDYLFVAMSGKVNGGSVFTPRKYITKCSREITPISGIYFTFYNTNTLYNNTRAHANKPTLDLDNSILSTLLKPKDTNNAVVDIISKAKFYESVDSFKVYDDVLYKEDLLKRLYNIELILTRLTLPSTTIKQRVDFLYPTQLKNEASSCERLSIELFEKYKNIFSKDYASVDNDPASIKVANYTKVIESILSSKLRDLPVSVYIGSGISNAVNTISHNLDKVNYRLMVLNLNTGKEITKDCTYATIDQNNITVEYSGSDTSAFNMTVCVLVSNRSTLNIHKSSLASFQKETAKTLVYKFNKSVINRKCSIDIHAFNVLYGFYEIRQGSDIIIPVDVVMSGDTIDFTFDKKVEGKVDIFLLPNNSILRGASKTKVTVSNIVDIMKSTNLLDPRITIWREEND